MNNKLRIKTLGFVVGTMLFTTPAFAAPKTYQVTGPILEATDSLIAIQKGKDRWEIVKTPTTKVTGDLKVGSKATVEYTMTAVTAEAKAAKPEKAAK